MPLHNQIVKHITAEDKAVINENLARVDGIIDRYVVNLNGDERQKYGSIDEENKLFANKVMDYRTNEPGKSSPNVDWTEYVDDFADRATIEAWINFLNSAVDKLGNAKILHDFDNYQNALVDYKYTQYMDDTEVPGYKVKREELAQFFKRPGGGDEDGTPPAG